MNRLGMLAVLLALILGGVLYLVIGNGGDRTLLDEQHDANIEDGIGSSSDISDQGEQVDVEAAAAR